ncbi:hypothetical protein HYH03_010979 [Edaphochlamys debaryana]|uniref:Uncharacterized protein n=1 Tax=Edaphochlamys debaryana TaxID=47281 RepID=A0A836BVL4_9CHLO|nr:hypothetical protein HYH03_010979 [Edaphochlamys debaryana]|eukprot:KAG2490585.1 hypothetical protein HYH03_010979 [Edaphochlamys debaryana]
MQRLTGKTAQAGPTDRDGGPHVQGQLLLARKAELEDLGARVEALASSLDATRTEARRSEEAREQTEMLLLERLIAVEGSLANGRAIRSAWAEQQDIRQLQRRLRALSSQVSSALGWLGVPAPGLGGARGAGSGLGGSALSGSEEERGSGSGSGASSPGESEGEVGLQVARAAGHGGRGKGASSGRAAKARSSDQREGGKEEQQEDGAARAGGAGRWRASGASGGGLKGGAPAAGSVAPVAGPVDLPPALQAAVERAASAAVAAAMGEWQAAAAARRLSDDARLEGVAFELQGLRAAHQAAAAPLASLAGLWPRLEHALHALRLSSTGHGQAPGAGADNPSATLGGSSAPGPRAVSLGAPGSSSGPTSAPPLGSALAMQDPSQRSSPAGGGAAAAVQGPSVPLPLGNPEEPCREPGPSATAHGALGPAMAPALEEACRAVAEASGLFAELRSALARAPGPAAAEHAPSTRASEPPSLMAPGRQDALQEGLTLADAHGALVPAPALPLPAGAGGRDPPPVLPALPPLPLASSRHVNGPVAIPTTAAPAPVRGASASTGGFSAQAGPWNAAPSAGPFRGAVSSPGGTVVSSALSVVSLAELGLMAPGRGQGPVPQPAAHPGPCPTTSASALGATAAAAVSAPQTLQPLAAGGPGTATAAAMAAEGPVRAPQAGPSGTGPTHSAPGAGPGSSAMARLQSGSGPDAATTGLRPLALGAALATQLDAALQGLCSSADLLQRGTAAAAEAWARRTGDGGSAGGAGPSRGSAGGAGRGGETAGTAAAAAGAQAVTVAGDRTRAEISLGGASGLVAGRSQTLESLSSRPQLAPEPLEVPPQPSSPPPASYDSFLSPKSARTISAQKRRRQDSSPTRRPAPFRGRGNGDGAAAGPAAGVTAPSGEPQQQRVEDDDDSRWGWLSDDEESPGALAQQLRGLQLQSPTGGGVAPPRPLQLAAGHSVQEAGGASGREPSAQDLRSGWKHRGRQRGGGSGTCDRWCVEQPANSVQAASEPVPVALASGQPAPCLCCKRDSARRGQGHQHQP